MDKEKIINILLILVILGAAFGGRYYYLQSTKANSSIENVQKKVEQIYEDISELEFKTNNLHTLQLSAEKSRLERQLKQLKKQLDNI